MTRATSPLLFDKLLEPLAATLQQLDAEMLSQAAKKPGFWLFVRLLRFRLFARIESLGMLVLYLKTQPLARATAALSSSGIVSLIALSFSGRFSVRRAMRPSFS